MTEPSTQSTSPDPDAVAALWLAEDHQARDLAEIRAQLDDEARADWLDDAKATERTRRHLDAIRRRRIAHVPPPPVAAAPPPQRLDVHHTFGPQTATSPSTGHRLALAVRLLTALLPIAVIVGLFLVLIASALVLDPAATPEQRAEAKVEEHRWSCDDVDEIAALTIDDEGVLWHWITPVGPCDELGGDDGAQLHP